MSGMTCCPLSGDGETATVSTITRPKSSKEHRCEECDEIIPVGAHYERTEGLWDGSWRTYKTCLSCVEIRDHFQCDGWLFGCLWEDLECNFFPDMKAGGPCMEGLSPGAKERLFTRRTQWLFEREHRRTGAPPPRIEP